MPDKFIYIKRAKPFIHEGLNTAAMRDIMASTKKGVGAFFKERDSVLSGTGLDDTEVNLLLPAVIGLAADKEGFLSKVETHYQNINTLVPYGDGGKMLNIGLKKDNNAPISKENMPIKLGDYIAYRHAYGRKAKGELEEIKGHPRVARTPEEAQGNSLIQFYFEDPELVLRGKIDKQNVDDQALATYLQVKSNPKKVNMVITLMSNRIKAQPGKAVFDPFGITDGEKLIHLKELAEKYPAEFNKFATDTTIAKKYFVNVLLLKQIIQRNGDVIVDGTTRRPLGKTLGEVVRYLDNPENLAIMNDYKVAAERIGVKLLEEELETK
jgi:hypothetical protein